jgi:hypothetical protein
MGLRVIKSELFYFSALGFLGWLEVLLVHQFQGWIRLDNQIFEFAFDRGLNPVYAENHFLLGFTWSISTAVCFFLLLWSAWCWLVEMKESLVFVRPSYPFGLFLATSLSFSMTIYLPPLGITPMLVGLFMLVREALY